MKLFRLITGKEKGGELIGNTAVEFGNRAEPVMRELFKLKHPEYTVEYHQYDILSQEENPFIRATLDGELHCDTPKRFGQNNARDS